MQYFNLMLLIKRRQDAWLVNFRLALMNLPVEKPSTKNAPSNKAVIGRYILPKTIFNKLAKQKEKVQMFSFYDKIFPEVNLEEGFVRIILPEFAEIK